MLDHGLADAESLAASQGLPAYPGVTTLAPVLALLHVQPGLLLYAVQVFGLCSMSVSSQILPKRLQSPVQ